MVCVFYLFWIERKKHTKVHGFSLFLLPRQTMSFCGSFLTSVHVPANYHLAENENVEKKKKKKRRFCYHKFLFTRKSCISIRDQIPHHQAHTWENLQFTFISHIDRNIFDFLFSLKIHTSWSFPKKKKICSKAAFASYEPRKTLSVAVKTDFGKLQLLMHTQCIVSNCRARVQNSMK